MLSFVLGVIALIVSAFVTARLLEPSSTFYVLDHPNERSLHERPVPRGGGLAIVAAVVCSALVLLLIGHVVSFMGFMVLVAAILIAIVSFVDDRGHLPIVVRLGTHVLVSVMLATAGLYLTSIVYPGGAVALNPIFGIAISALFMIWMINLYNFMDGMDGFAGGMTVFGFGTFAAMGIFAGAPVIFTALNAAIAGAAAGFLFFNFPPARIFMGDVGSSSLGLMAAAMTIWADRDTIFPLWLGLLVFSPFIVDATVTLLRRMLTGERFWRAHKTHYYQRLVQAGWGHRRAVLAEYALMATMALIAIVSVHANAATQWLALACSTVLFIVLAWAVGHQEQRHRAGQSSQA